MKKWLASFMALSLILAACGQTDDDETKKMIPLHLKRNNIHLKTIQKLRIVKTKQQMKRRHLKKMKIKQLLIVLVTKKQRKATPVLLSPHKTIKI